MNLYELTPKRSNLCPSQNGVCLANKRLCLAKMHMCLWLNCVCPQKKPCVHVPQSSDGPTEG